MSNIKVVIDERPADIGNFAVGRLLPYRSKRMVGPFIFIDHMGPADLKPEENVDVGPHPHIGLATITYLFDGSLFHRDSLGNALEIKPGEVNWMTAGKGIVHSERTPDYLRNTNKKFHGLQIWIALPKDKEQMEPEFIHIEKASIPEWFDSGVSYKLIAGEALGKKSPVPVYSKMFFLEIKTKLKFDIKICKNLYGEAGIYILEGSLTHNGVEYKPKQLIVSEDLSDFEFKLNSDSVVYIVGGIPFPEERFIYWNFVSSEKDLIEKVKVLWFEQKFPKIPGETGFVPLPKPKTKTK